MAAKIYKTALVLSVLMTILIFSCNKKYYISSNFRQTYSNLDQVPDQDAGQSPFFKVHFKNGNVSLLENWRLNEAKDSLAGEGNLYDFNRNQIQTGVLRFPVEEIAIIETNQLEAIKSRDSERVTALAILAGANIVLGVICLTNPKACFGSCPTFYIERQAPLQDARAEGFSSSIAPSLEKKDLDALQYSAPPGKFQIFMKNEAYETHVVNEVLLYAVPKNKEDHIFHDKNDQFYRCGEPYSLNQGFAQGKPIGDLIQKIDKKEYFSTTDSLELATPEEIYLEFPFFHDEKQGLVLNFRQTLLTTFLLYSGLSYMGDEVGDYFARIETSKMLRKKLGEPFDRLGKIKLYYWNELSEKWQFFEELHETGPIAKNLIMAPLPRMKFQAGKLKIKIELTKGLWRLDYVGLSPVYESVEPRIIRPNDIEVFAGNAENVQTIQYADANHLISLPGNEFGIKFELPETEHAEEYELFLSAQGYYLEWMRKEWMKDKNIDRLKKMLRNDPRTWRALASEFKEVEPQMEEVFWNSKYSEIQ